MRLHSSVVHRHIRNRYRTGLLRCYPCCALLPAASLHMSHSVRSWCKHHIYYNPHLDLFQPILLKILELFSTLSFRKKPLPIYRAADLIISETTIVTARAEQGRTPALFFTLLHSPFLLFRIGIIGGCIQDFCAFPGLAYYLDRMILRGLKLHRFQAHRPHKNIIDREINIVGSRGQDNFL